MKDFTRWQRIGLGAVVLLSALFAYLNSGERVALSLGLFDLYQVSLVALIFVAFLVGMLTMFLLGLRHDVQVRRALRERGFDVPAGPATREISPVREVREERPAYGAPQVYDYDPTPARETPPAPPFPPYPPPDPEP